MTYIYLEESTNCNSKQTISILPAQLILSSPSPSPQGSTQFNTPPPNIPKSPTPEPPRSPKNTAISAVKTKPKALRARVGKTRDKPQGRETAKSKDKPQNKYGEHVVPFSSTSMAAQAFAVSASTSSKTCSQAPMYHVALDLPYMQDMATIISEISKELAANLVVSFAS